MSLTLNMVGGGGGGGTYAFIVVTYPSGSTCTCSNGTKTLTAEGTTGNFVFNIPSADTWAVSCTDGQRTVSKTVIITSEGQSESVTLAYIWYVLKDGVLDSQFSWAKNGSQGFDTFANGVISCSSVPGNQGFSGSIFSPSVDVSDYSKLVFHTQQTGIANGNTAFCIRVGLSRGATDANSTATRKAQFSFYTELTQTSNNFVDLTVDVSSATTGLYIATVGNCAYKVDEIYLEI